MLLQLFECKKGQSVQASFKFLQLLFALFGQVGLLVSLHEVIGLRIGRLVQCVRFRPIEVVDEQGAEESKTHDPGKLSPVLYKRYIFFH